MKSVVSECWILAALFGLGFTATVLLVSPARAAAMLALRPTQDCIGTQDPHQYSCTDCTLTYQSGIVSGSNCTPCRYGYSWTIICGTFESGGSQADQLDCGEDLGPITVPCPGGGTAFSFSFACSECQ